jgi:hypothetical protein
MEQGNEEQSGRMVCPETLDLIYIYIHIHIHIYIYESLWAGQKTKLPLALKL